jgi:hypothetical protein
MISPLNDYQLRHYRALIERERTHSGQTAAGILLAATLARLQHLERRLAQGEDMAAALRYYADREYNSRTAPDSAIQWHADRALAAWAPTEGQEP